MAYHFTGRWNEDSGSGRFDVQEPVGGTFKRKRMKVKIIRSNPTAWYCDCVGMSFHAFAQQGNNQFLFFTNNFYFYPEDIEVSHEKNAVMPCFQWGQA